MREEALNTILRSLYIVLFCALPWSAEWSFGSWAVRLPSEPLLLLIGTVWILYGGRWMWEGKWPTVPHAGWKLKGWLPLVLSGIWIGWQWVCTLYSTMPVVSAKYMIVETAQWSLFGVGTVLIPDLWRRVLPWLAVSMAIFVVYAWIHHAQYDFRADQAMLAPMPFFPDHTSYAAVLAMLLPWVIGGHLFPQKKWLTIGLAIVLAGGLMTSTCRAAVLSVFMTAAFLPLFFGENIRRGWLLAFTAMLVGGLVFKTEISARLGPLLHRDVSSMERLNRYDCAAQMLKARPGVGFGPGTYQFQYLPFQRPEKMTRISVLQPVTTRSADTFGRGGGAHSAYWQAASEAGWIGLLLWSGLVVCVVGQVVPASRLPALWSGTVRRVVPASRLPAWWSGTVSRVVNAWQFPAWCRRAWMTRRTLHDPTYLIFLSLMTFFLHSFVNNFLHEGIISALVWGQVGYFLSKSHQIGR